MAQLRLAIVTPRFWPLVGDGPAHWLRLAESFVDAGHDVTVVTPQWKRTWPREMVVGTVRLVRLRGSGRGGWSTIRWVYALSRWLARQPLDAVLVAGLRHEAHIALGAAHERGWPVLVLAEEGDVAWQQTAAFGSRIMARCLSAKAIVVRSDEEAGILIRSAYAPQQLVVIPRRVAVPPPLGPAQRDAARTSLVTANHDLLTTPATRVALAVGRFEPSQRFGDLVRAWRIVTARQPQARLWLVGDGPDRDQLYRQIGDLDQRFRVLLPGTFDSRTELLAAADIVLVPGAPASPPLVLLEAQAAGLPVVAASSPAVCEYVVHEQTGLTYPPRDFKALAGAVDRLWKDPATAVRYGAAARAATGARPTPADEASEYLSLIARLLAER